MRNITVVFLFLISAYAHAHSYQCEVTTSSAPLYARGYFTLIVDADKININKTKGDLVAHWLQEKSYFQIDSNSLLGRFTELWVAGEVVLSAELISGESIGTLAVTDHFDDRYDDRFSDQKVERTVFQCVKRP